MYMYMYIYIYIYGDKEFRAIECRNFEPRNDSFFIGRIYFGIYRYADKSGP